MNVMQNERVRDADNGEEKCEGGNVEDLVPE